MRRLVVAVLIVVSPRTRARRLWWRPSAPTAPAPAAAPAAPAPVAAPPRPAATIGDRSANETVDVRAVPAGGTSCPADLKSAIDAKQPTLIFFYDSSASASKDNRKIIDAVRNDNRGLVDLVAYDIEQVRDDVARRARSPSTRRSPATRVRLRRVQLAKALGVTSAPFVVLTDGQGYIIWQVPRARRQAFLEREVLRAAR